MTPPPARRAGARSVVAAAVCAGLALAVYQAGLRDLRPAGWPPAGWARWWDSVGPLVAVFALARLVLMAAAGLLALAFLAVSIDLLRSRAANPTRPARFTGRLLRASGLLRVVIGVGASGVAMAACGSGPASPARTPPLAPTLTNLDPAPAAPPPSPAPAPARVPAPAAGPQATPVAVEPPPPASPAPGPVPDTWRVRPGDSLWSIAQATVGSPPEGVAQYWAQLVRLNRARLPDPSDPSLIFPGEVIQLPPRRAAGP